MPNPHLFKTIKMYSNAMLIRNNFTQSENLGSRFFAFLAGEVIFRKVFPGLDGEHTSGSITIFYGEDERICVGIPEWRLFAVPAHWRALCDLASARLKAGAT